MIPVEIELHNFLAYRSPPPLRLEGIHVACLAGPNGAGKSSLLDALTWALWKKARAKGSDDLLVHQGQSEMRVAVTFDQEGRRYRVQRQHRSGKRAASVLELQTWDESAGGWRSLSEAGIRETQLKIDSLLRLDYETFVNSAFLVQGHADEFTTKTPSERKQVLGKILGLERWETYEQRARDRINDTRGAIQRVEGWLTEVEAELARREEYRDELAAAETVAEEARLTLEGARRRTSLEQTAASWSMQRSIDDLMRRITTAEREDAEAEIERKAALALADEAALATVRQDLMRQAQALVDVQAEAEAAGQSLSQVREEAASLRGLNQTLVPEAEPLKKRVDVLQSATEPLCPTCGQALTEDHRHQLIETLQTDIEARRDAYRANQTRLRELESSAGEIERAQADRALRLRGRPALERRLAETDAALAQAGQAAARAAALEARQLRWREEAARDREQRQDLELQAAAAEGRLRASSITQAELDRLGDASEGWPMSGSAAPVRTGLA
jgi:exonuclease SbcC